MEALYTLAMLTVFNVAIISLMVFIARPVHYLTQWAKMLGFGYLVWHSDSNKYFYALTYKDALEWMACTYASAAIFSNWSKEAISVKLA